MNMPRPVAHPDARPFRQVDRRGHARKTARLRVEVLAALVVMVLVALIGPAQAATLPEGAMAALRTLRSADDRNLFLGSAFLWRDGAVAVTNAHVIAGHDRVRLIDEQGREEIGTVIAADPLRDVAVVSVVPGGPGLVARSEPAGPGLEVYALGAPLGAEFSVSGGMISARARQVDPAVPLRLIQHDAAINPGSSGGALIDAMGRLVGMNTRIADGSRMFVGIGYAIAAADLDRIVTGLIDETLAPYPRLGLRARAIDRQVAAALGLPVGGVLVDAVEAGLPAGQAGLRAGDVILAVDGAVLRGAGDLPFAIEAAQPRLSADLAILRDGQAMLVILPLEPAIDPTTQGLVLRGLGTAALRRQDYDLAGLGIRLQAGGTGAAVVAAVTDTSPAAQAGLAGGDTILAMNGRELDAADLALVRLSAPAILLVRGQGGTTRHVLIDPWSPATGLRPAGGANVLDPAVVVF